MSRQRLPEKGWLAYYRGLIGSWAKGNTLPHDAEDAAQESVANLLDGEHAAVLDHKAYLYRSANNRLINEVRRQSRRASISLEDLADEDHPRLNDPDASLRTGELVSALETALSQLPLKKRQVFIHHRLEGYTQPEVAQKLGLATHTVERYVMEATRYIRDQLQDFCPK